MGIERAAQEGFRLEDGSPLILDIDEDYFAVDSPFISMMKKGMEKESLEKIQEGLKGPASFLTLAIILFRVLDP